MWPFSMDDEEEKPGMTPVAPMSMGEPQSPAQPMNPQVKDYLAQKYALDQYSPEKRMALEKQNEEEASGPNILAGLAAFGAGLQGGNAAQAGSNFLNMQKQQRQGKLDAFDKNRALALQDMNDQQMLAKRDRENDPNSEESKMAQSLAVKMGMDPAKASTLTAAKFAEVSPALSKMYSIDEGVKIREQSAEDRKAEIAERSAARKAEEAQRYADKKALQDEKKAALAEKEAFKKTTEGKLQHLNTGDKARFDSAKMGYQAVDDMSRALAAGENTFSLIGDNNFTQASRLFEEALGRMQSGGAINKEEEARFRQMRPKVSDSAEMQKKKLAQLQKEMGSRLQTLGFQPEEIGLASLPKDGRTVVDRKINPKQPGKMKLVYSDGTEEIVDSAVANNGR